LSGRTYENLKEIARNRGTSLNKLATESIELLVAQETDAKLRAAYDALGRESAESSVEEFLDAQRETLTDERE
jgi:predicted HicB family RNase H-like nuclease